MSDPVAILVAVLLLGTNAFFVGAEFSLISARRDRLESMAERGVARARLVIRAGERLSLMLAAAQLGITISSLGLGALGEPAVAALLKRAFGPVELPGAVLHPLAFVLALGIVTVLHILLGEMVPKNIAIAGPERVALWLVPVLVSFTRAARPVIGALNWLANRVLLAVRIQPRDELSTAYTPGELGNLIADSRSQGLLDQQEHRRLTQTLSTAERTVGDVFVPVERLTMLPAEPVLADVERAVTRTGFSRFPLRDTAGRLTGYLHVKDVLGLAGTDPQTPVPVGNLRALPRVPATAKLDQALATLRRTRSHLARVVDPRGATVGVVALEDLVEEYVGTVRDATHVPRPRSS